MDLAIKNETLKLTIYGFSGVAVNRDYKGMAFSLMDKMWKVVKAGSLKNKGLNIWVYEPGEKVFAGVELYDPAPMGAGLEEKSVSMAKYAYYKHTGSYNLLKQAGMDMQAALKKRGLETISPYIEIYGHWTNDETKLETELLMALK